MILKLRVSCLSIARAHASCSEAKNSLALLARAVHLSSKCLGVVLSSPASKAESKTTINTTINEYRPAKIFISPERARSLQSLLESELTRQHAHVELSNRLFPDVDQAPLRESSSSAAAAVPVPLIENLNRYPDRDMVDLAHLVTYPPRLEPVPVKPLFLDVAWNYIDYPGRRRLGPSMTTMTTSTMAGNTHFKVTDSIGRAGSVSTSSLDGGEGGKEQVKPASAGKRGWFGFGRS